MPEHNYLSNDSACGAACGRFPSVSCNSVRDASHENITSGNCCRSLDERGGMMSDDVILRRLPYPASCFSVGTVRTVFYARSGDIPLPRRDRLALLANHVLRRAVRTLSRGFWLSVSDGSEWCELAGGHGKGAHRVPTRSAPFPCQLARTAEL